MAEDNPIPDPLKKYEDIFTGEQLSDLREAFNIFDHAGEGHINPRKLGDVMKALGWNPTEAEVQDLIAAVDKDGNGEIEFDEFCDMMIVKLSEKDRNDELREAFSVFDRDGNGEISIGELSTVLGRLGLKYSLEEREAMMEAADLDGDKLVTYEDFLNVFHEDDAEGENLFELKEDEKEGETEVEAVKEEGEVTEDESVKSYINTSQDKSVN